MDHGEGRLDGAGLLHPVPRLGQPPRAGLHVDFHGVLVAPHRRLIALLSVALEPASSTKALVPSAVKPDPKARLPPRQAPAPEMQATQGWRARSPAQTSSKPASRGGHAPPSFRHPHGSRAGLPPGVGYEARTGRVPPPGGRPHRDGALSGRAQDPRGCPLRVGAPSGRAHPPEVRTHRGGVENWLSGSGRMAH